MHDLSVQHHNYQRIRDAIVYLHAHQHAQPSLPELAKHVGVSEYHLQRIFTEWAGVSPKQFLQYITKENAKKQLQSMSVMDSALACGLSGSGRLHDLMIRCEAVTPGEYRRQGEGLNIYFGIHSCHFGFCLIALTQRGVCKWVFFDAQHDAGVVIDALKQDWPAAKICQDEARTQPVLEQVFGLSPGAQQRPLNVLLKGSPFQIKVWEALLRIPCGNLRSYQHVARSIGKPSSVRAVASAIANNSVAYLIPCHRVIRSTGVLNNYRWGEERKAAMIGWEASEAALGESTLGQFTDAPMRGSDDH